MAMTSIGRWLMPHNARRPPRLPGRDSGQTGGLVVPDPPRHRRLPDERRGGEHRREPARDPQRVGDHRGRDEGGTDDRAVGAAGRCPRRPRALDLGGDQLSEDGAAETEREGGRSQPLADRAQHHRTARDRRQQHVTDVGDLDGDRAAVGAAAQAECERRHDEHSDDRRTTFEQIGGVDAVADHPVDGLGDPDDEGQPDQCEQVDAVGDVVPVGVAEPAALTGRAQLGQGGLRRSLIRYHHGLRKRVRRHRRKNVLPRLHTCVVDTETVQLFVGLLTITAAVGAIAVIVLRVLAAAGNDGAARLGSSISDSGVWLAWIVAAGATVGSLYFSEVANFNPCRFCWFQRIAMYPLSVILLVGALRKDPNVRWYAAPLAIIGAVISGWHSLIEWQPALDNGECEFQGPSCTFVWFREFGFSLANMALIGFLTILILLLVRFPARLDAAAGTSPSEPEMEHSS